MSVINLQYWSDIPNYGDYLGVYVLEKLTKKEVVSKKLYKYYGIRYFVKKFFSIAIKLKNPCKTDVLFPFQSNLLFIGSILRFSYSKSSVWGAGYFSANNECRGGKIFAVRGFMTLELLKKQKTKGIPIKFYDKVAVGDPAVLLPLIYSPTPKNKKRFGIIPHFSEFDYFAERYGEKYKIIDLKSNDVEKITDEITSCDYVLSSSLHGLIVAHAYGIPALWIEHSGLEPWTKGFKFYDYLSSVKICKYSPIKDLDNLLSSERNILDTFNLYKNQSLPIKDISVIQRELLSVSPIEIKTDILRNIF